MPPTHSRNFRPLSRSPQISLATRRRFLQASAAAVSGIVLSNCARNLSSSSPESSPNQPSSGGGAANKTLNIYTWAGYTDDELTNSFRDATGIQVVVNTYDSNEIMLNKVQVGGGKQYSIIYPTDYMVQQMIEKDMLTSLDKSRLKGIDQLMEQWQNPVYDPENAHSVPAVWGTTGLIYDPEQTGGDIEGWDYVWDNADQLDRQLTMINDVREVMGATLKYLGYSYNSTKQSEIEEAYEKLLEVKPAIASFITNGWEEQLASGDLQLAMGFSTDALALMEESPNLKYIVPESGASLWTDTMVIPKSAPNPDAAYEWINFINQPDNSAKLVERLKISTPNQAAFDKLSDDLKQDENLFPSKQVLAKCEGIAPVPQATDDLHERYWTQLTST